jgi:hypothetical protein
MNTRTAAIVLGFIMFNGSGCGSPGWTDPSKSGFQRWQELRECRREASVLSTGFGGVQSSFETALEDCMTSKGYSRL